LYCTEYVNDWNNPGADHLEQAHELARKGCATDEFDPLSRQALGVTLMWMRRLDEAEQALRRAIELDPNLSQARGGLGNVLDFGGRHEDAIRQFEQALRLDPEFDLWIHALGRAQFALERYDQAEASFKRRLIRMPRSDVTRAYLASLYGHTGRHEEARQLWAELMAINPKFSVDHLRRVMPFKTPATLDRLAEGFRKAGIAQQD
jgi:adenylate cyclase